MAKSKIRVAIEAIGAARVAGDLRSVNEAAKALNRTLTSLSGISSSSFAGLDAAGRSASRAARGFSELRKATANFPSTKSLVENLTKLGSIDVSGLARAGGAVRGVGHALASIGSASAGIAGLASSINSLSAAGPGHMPATAKALDNLTRALRGASAGVNLGPLAAQITALANVPIGNLANIGKAFRNMASGIRAIAGLNLAPFVANLRALGAELSSRRLQRGLTAISGLAPGLAALGTALRRMGTAAPGLAALSGALATLAAALNTTQIRDALRNFAALGPELTNLAKALASLGRSANNFHNFNSLAAGIDRVTEALKRMAVVSNDQNLQRLLQNLRDIRAAPAGPGGGAGAGGAGGRGRGSAARGLSKLVTTPFGYAQSAAKLAFAGIKNTAQLGVTAISKVLSATRALAGTFVRAGVFGFHLFEGLGSRALGVARTVGKLAIATALGTGGLGLGLKKAFESDNSLTTIENTLKVVTGSAGAARSKFLEIAPAIDAMGLSIADIAPAFAQFNAAAVGTALAGKESERVFFSVARAGQALSLSTEQQKGIFLALQQIMSKGTVQAEELRGQIGERLPGAFNIAARAMGLTSQELDKLLRSGKLSATEFLPKFANQLDKEFGNAAAAAKRPAAALDRLKNTFFDTFSVIGRNGVTDVVVRGLNAVSAAVRQLTVSGTIAAWTRQLVARLNAAGNKIGAFAKTVKEAYAIISRPGISGRQIVSSPGNPFGPLTDPNYIALFGRNRRAVARGYADLYNLIRAFGQLVRKDFRNAFGGPNVSTGVAFLQSLNRGVSFIGYVALPAALNGVKKLFSLLSGGTRFVRDFFSALGQTDAVDQFKLALGSIGSLFTSIGNGLGITERKFRGSTAAEKFAAAVANGAHVIRFAIDKVVTVMAYFEAFLIRLGRNGTFKRIGKDAKDFFSLLAGTATIGNKDLTKAPETLADAFGAAYTRISDGFRATYAEIAKISRSFVLGFKFENKARGAIARDAKHGNKQAQSMLDNNQTPDVQVPGDAQDQQFAGLGQTIARLANALSGAFEPVVTLGIAYAKALGTAATWMLNLLNGVRNLVGDAAFGKLSGLVASLLLLNKIGGFSIGGGVGGVAGGFVSSLLSGMGGVFKSFLVQFAFIASGGTSASAASAAAAIASLAAIGIGGFAAIGKASDTRGSTTALDDAGKAFNNGEYAKALFDTVRAAYHSLDADGTLVEGVQKSRFARDFGIGPVYGAGGNGMSTREQRDAIDYHNALIDQRNNAANSAKPQTSAFANPGEVIGIQLRSEDGKTLNTVAPAGPQTSAFLDAARTAQQGQNGQTTAPFFGGSR